MKLSQLTSLNVLQIGTVSLKLRRSDSIFEKKYQPNSNLDWHFLLAVLSYQLKTKDFDLDISLLLC